MAADNTSVEPVRRATRQPIIVNDKEPISTFERIRRNSVDSAAEFVYCSVQHRPYVIVSVSKFHFGFFGRKIEIGLGRGVKPKKSLRVPDPFLETAT